MAPVFVVTGPSGAGKGTLIRGLLEQVPSLEVAVSATTRSRRPGEVDGREYWFLSDEDFERRVGAGGFLEWVSYVSGRRYGTLLSEIERIGADGRVCVLELELEGALRVQDEVLGSVTNAIAANVKKKAPAGETAPESQPGGIAPTPSGAFPQPLGTLPQG